ncbi:MAG: branched-chain amino acid ABC transporter permease [Candidatus Bipolaricaulia bacterium]
MDLLAGALNYIVFFSITAVIYAILSLGLNIQWGYTGLFNIGVAGFFAIGAYSSALISGPPPAAIDWRIIGGFELPFVVGMLGGAVAAGLAAAIISLPTLRLKEDYLAITTVGIAEAIRLIAKQESWLTNGVFGITNIPAPLYQPINNAIDGFLAAHPNLPEWLIRLIGNGYNWFFLLLVVLFLLIAYLAIEKIIRSPWGRVLAAIREDETVAKVSGKNVFGFKVQSMVLGAMLMGAAGSFYAHFAMAISPSDFKPLMGTFIVWVMLIAGGSGNNKGAILGAFTIWGIWAGSGFLGGYLPISDTRTAALRIVIIGLLLEVILLNRPEGLLGEEKGISKLLEK